MFGVNRDTAAALREAVGAVPDPELHQSLAELGMLRDVRVSRNGRAEVEIALTTAGCPMTSRLTREVTAAAVTVAGISQVEVRFTVMSEPDRRALAERFLATRLPPRQAPAREVYAVASGKGGVGKSSVAANLAVAWPSRATGRAARRRRLGLLGAPAVRCAHSPVAMDELMLPVQAHGVALMSLGFLVRGAPVVWRGPMLHKALNQFVRTCTGATSTCCCWTCRPGPGT